MHSSTIQLPCLAIFVKSSFNYVLVSEQAACTSRNQIIISLKKLHKFVRTFALKELLNKIQITSTNATDAISG